MNLVFFHADCNDGLAAAHAFHTYVKGDNKYFPMTHQEIKSLNLKEFLKNYPNELTIYILDITFTHEQYVLLSQMDKVGYVLTIDHHVSVVKALENQDLSLPKIHFVFSSDNTVSACTMTEQYLKKTRFDDDIPMMYRLIQDRDIWKNQLSDSKAYCTYFHHHYTRKQNKDNIEELLKLIDANELSVHNGITEGKVLNDYFNSQIKSVVDSKQHYPVDFVLNGVEYHGFAINTWNGFSSDVGAELCLLDENRPFAIVWRFTGKDFKCSVRSRNDFDCSHIAVAMGGGGHAQSCAFNADLNDMKDLGLL